MWGIKSIYWKGGECGGSKMIISFTDQIFRFNHWTIPEMSPSPPVQSEAQKLWYEKM